MINIRVSLLFVPTQTNEASAEAPAVDNQGGVFPPLQLAYLGAILQKYNHQVDIIDINALHLTMEETKERIQKFKADIIGFSTGVVMWRETLKWARFMKKNLAIKIVIGNIIMTEYPKEALSHEEIDYGIIGHDYQSLLGLLDAMQGKKEYSKIEGLVYKNKGKIKINPFVKRKKHSLKDINKLPFPARYLLPNHKYFEFFTKNRNFTLMLTSTGCIYKCKFCHVRFDPLIFRPILSVVDEMEECYTKYKIREIDFKDNTFTIDRNRTLVLCHEIQKRGLHKKIKWSCMTRVNLVDEPLLMEMNQAGCVHIKYGIESGSQKILDKLWKDTTIDAIRTAIYLTRKHHMETYGFFMIGVPGETKETALETIRFAQTLGFDTISPAFSEAEECCDKRGNYPELKKELGYDMWSRYVSDENYKLPKRNIYTDLTEEEVNKFAVEAYRRFYFRPQHILGSFGRIPNFDAIKRGGVAALSILTNGASNRFFHHVQQKIRRVKDIKTS